MPDTVARLLLLGAAQDAGVPQCGCHCENCTAVRQGVLPRQHAVSAALLDDAEKTAWLLDCTPDFKEQYDLLQQQAPGYALEGVLLTHLHSGHYMGLIHFGREMMDWKGLKVVGPESICKFLQCNEPWATYIRDGHFALSELTPTPFDAIRGGNTSFDFPTSGLHPQHDNQDHCHPRSAPSASHCNPGVGTSDFAQQPQHACGSHPPTQQLLSASTDETRVPCRTAFRLSSRLQVQAVYVPHRAEFSECVAYRVLASSGRSAFYCPDIDSWATWEQDVGIEPVAWAVRQHTYAFLDACFYSGEELPGRDMSQIPHPLVQDTLKRLELAAPWSAEAVVLQHMNHSNPIYRETAARRACLDAGVVIGEQGQVFKL